MKKTKIFSFIVATTVIINTYSPCKAGLFDMFRKKPTPPINPVKKVADSCIYGLYGAGSAAGSVGALALIGLLLRKAHLRFTKQDEISVVKSQNPEIKEMLEKNEDLIVRVYGNDKKFITTMLGISAICGAITGATGYATKLMFENLVKTLRKK